MYCVIQELKLKRADSFGAYKDLEISTNPFNYTRTIPQYGYFDGGERHERPVKKAYKISIHESKRINGVVTKKQFVVTTVGYYTFAIDWFCIGEYDKKISDIADRLNTDYETIYNLIENKVSPLAQRIRDEFMQTEEYAASQKHKAIIAEYKKQKALFSEKYNIPDSEYDYCFNVFGEMVNAEHYENIVNGRSIQSTFRQFQTTQTEPNLLQGVC